jgi:monoamine oxidase
MSTAFELGAAGHDVTILEARPRPGGRVLTLREPFADGLYAEAGAMQVFDNHARALKYLAQFELPIDPIKPSGTTSLLYVSGHRFEVKAGQPIDWPFDVHHDERGLLPAALWTKYVVPVLNDVEEADANGTLVQSLGEYDRLSFSDFLRKRGASEAAVAILRVGLPNGLGDGADRVSALNLLRESIHRRHVKQSHTIRGGTDRLPKAFAERLKDRIVYGAPVVRIEHQSDGVKVVCDRSGAPRTFTGDRLVCAAPFSTIRRIEIAPALSREKQAAIAQLEYTSVARVFVQMRRRFWQDEGLSGGASTDLPVMSVFERSLNQPGPRAILESYVAGSEARALTAMTERDRVTRTLDGMRRLFPNVDQFAESGASKCWDEDEWSRGAYAWFRPGQMTSLLPAIARAEGRIHFAGEHTSSQPGWMEGAFESAERVVREITEARS